MNSHVGERARKPGAHDRVPVAEAADPLAGRPTTAADPAGAWRDRGPTGIWSTGWRLGLAFLLGAVPSALVLVENVDGTTRTSPLDWWLDGVVGLVCLVLVAWRRRWPLAVVSVVGLAGAVSPFSGGPWLLAVVSIATRRRWPDTLVVIATSVLGAMGYDRLHPTDDPTTLWFTPAFGIVLVGALTAYGWYVGARRDLVASLRERAETAEREKLAFLASARSNERAAIAREMHDVLAHRISLVAMHAGALTFRPDLDEAQRLRIARTIEENAQLALADLRDVLGVLRNPAATWDTPPDRPQPTLQDVPALVAETVAAGTPVALDLDVAAEAPTTLGRHAYRIAQESLTNARKHAPGRSVTLRITGAPGGDLVVESVNPLPLHPTRTLTGAGAGLAGMAERAVLARGTLEHGATPDGRFRVLARLPWAPLGPPLDPALTPVTGRRTEQP